MASASSIKVSVNGRKYQISGITKKTSCKDLLCALAKTTSCDRQLDLFEKWRDCERRLPLTSEPLDLLDCLGTEGAAKVKFIARERGVEIQPLTIKDKATTKHHRSHQESSTKHKTDKSHRKKKRSPKMPSLDDTAAVEDGHRHRRSHRHTRRRHSDVSDEDTYSDLLRAVINQAKELKSQVRDIRKSDQSKFELMDYYTKPVKSYQNEKVKRVSNSCSVDNDNDSGVPSIGDDSSQDSISRDDNESNMSDKDERRQRIDSGLASELSVDQQDDIVVNSALENSCNCPTTAVTTNNNNKGDPSADDEENGKRNILWKDYQKLCVQLCELYEQLEITKLTSETSVAELACLDAVHLLGSNEADEEHENERLEKEVDVTKSLIESVQNLTMYQSREITSNSNQISDYEADLKSRTILYESLSMELDCLQLRTAPRRLLQRCKHGKGASVCNSVDGVSLV